MERNREARRVSMAAANGLTSRRRHRTGSLRDSPEDDGPVELQETARLRDRGTGKKDRDRERDRDRDRDRDRERERERDRERDRDRMSSRGKRRRGDRLISSNREDGVVGNDDSSEESVNDDDDDGGAGMGTSMRMLPPNPSSLGSSSLSNHIHRKSFPPPTKVFRTVAAAAATTVAPPWKAPDEMIGVSVPRKARSASTKRSHEWASSCGVGISEQLHRQASTSPARSSGGAPPALASASASPAPVSPSSSNASVKKKMKPNGPKQRPPKSSPKFNTTTTSTSSNQEEIEIEIAEVLYGLTRQPQGPSKQDSVIASNDLGKYDSRDVASNHNNNNNNKYSTTVDAKSRVSSPISNSFSPSILPSSSSAPPTNNSTSSAIAPKRKRPRPVKYDDENPSVYPARSSPITSAIKADTDQPAKIETSPNLDKNSGSAAENGLVSSHDTRIDQAAAAESNEKPQPDMVKPENNLLSDSKLMKQESESKRDSVVNKEEPQSPKKESSPPSIAGLRLDDDRERMTIAKPNSTVNETEIQQEDKFQIDLMAPPPSRSSPERDSEIDSVDPKPIVTDVEMERKPAVKKDDDKAVKVGKDVNVEQEVKKAKITTEEIESQKLNVNSIKERNIDLQLDLEKSDRDSVTVSGSGNKLNHHIQKQHQQQSSSEKAAQTNSLPLPMSLASWPGGLPHMGYMTPLQGVVSMDGSTVPSAAIQPPHLLFNQPRPKRCATHCYIARNILCHQQFTRMNPFWPAAAGSALQFGAKPCNVNLVPSSDLHAGRAVSSVQDKGLAIFPGHTVKEKSSQASNIADAAQRKQIFLQQPLPPGAPSNILHGPAFIFPLNQQHAAAAAASVRPGTVKSSPVPSSAASSSTSSSISMSAAASAVAGATAMSFNYPNMPGNETQYLAILQNSAYPIPIPAHVGSAPTYRGTPPQAMPFFNGSFYSSQIIHPQQLQQQQPPASQSQQGQQAAPQNPSMSSGSSSSHKHLQNQQLRQPGGSISGGSANLQGFPTSKTQQSQTLQLQPRQQMQNQHAPHQARQLENELGEDSPSTADSRVSRANINIYGQNYAMPIHPPNFTLMTPPTVGGANTAGGNPGEKKQQSSQAQGSKVVEPSQAFAMSFASINGPTAGPSLDASSLAQNHALLQSLPEAARQGYHFMAAAVAQAAQQKKNYRVSEEGKTVGNDVLNAEDDRKSMPGGKVHTSAGQSIAFSRQDLTDSSVLTMQGNTLIDSSGRTLNLGANSARATGSVMSASISTVNASNAQQQMIQLQKQQHFAAAAAASGRSKTSATSNGNMYPEHVTTSSIAAKFPNALSGFPSNLVQSSSPAQSPQWKSSVRTSTSQGPSPSLASTSTSLKNLPQQQGRMQQGHTQISFAANPKPTATSQGQPTSNGNQSPSPPMVVNSPTTSSISKGAGGSPRTTSNSTGNKGGQSSTLSSQQVKNSSSAPAQKSSAPGRNISSIIGHPLNSTPSSSSSTKSQLPQQQQLPKHALQQAQMLYNNSYIQAQAQHAASSTHTTSGASGFYLQRHRNEQQQPAQGSSATSSGGMMMCPVSLSNAATTTDPAKAVAAAAAANSMKGGGLQQQGLIHAQFAAAQSSGKAHLVPTGFPYVHAVPSAVQVKPAEQKQPAAD